MWGQSSRQTLKIPSPPGLGSYYSAKFVVIGDVAVGKTSLIRQLTNKTITPQYHMTIGVDYSLKEIDIPKKDTPMKFHKLRYQLWDTAGQERFRSITSSYYRDATCAVLVFSLEDPSTFQRIVDVWYPEVVRVCSPHTHIILVGTKSDLCKYMNRTFKQSIRDWADSNSIPYYETNMTDTIAVHDIFYETGCQLFRLLESGIDVPGMKCMDVSIDDIALLDERQLSDNTNDKEYEKKWYDFWRWCF